MSPERSVTCVSGRSREFMTLGNQRRRSRIRLVPCAPLLETLPRFRKSKKLETAPARQPKGPEQIVEGTQRVRQMYQRVIAEIWEKRASEKEAELVPTAF